MTSTLFPEQESKLLEFKSKAPKFDALLKVCHIRRERQNKVFRGLTEKSRSTMGWFFGFKLHLVINDKGEIFKELSSEDSGVLPVINGLRYSDISISRRLRLDGSDERSIDSFLHKHRNPFEAVMDVLRLGQRAESVLPNKLIRQIMVDREIGITVYAFNKIKEIKLGHENYADKYDLLKKVLLYIKNINTFQDPVSIDLNNFNRAVVDLAK